MKWAEFTIITTEEASDAISEMLAQIGADGIAVTDPWEIKRIIDDPASLSYADGGFVNSLGEDVTVRAYFAELDGLIRLGPKKSMSTNSIPLRSTAISRVRVLPSMRLWISLRLSLVRSRSSLISARATIRGSMSRIRTGRTNGRRIIRRLRSRTAW